MGQLDRVWPPEDRAAVLTTDEALRPGDDLVVPHARVLGRTMRQRDLVMDDLATRGVRIAIPGLPVMLTDNENAKAQIHAAARQSTGKGTAKQSRNRGRPRRYKTFSELPEADQAQIIAWWDGPQQTDDALALISERIGKKVSRTAVYRLVGRGRADHPERLRKPVRKRKNTKEE